MFNIHQLSFKSRLLALLFIFSPAFATGLPKDYTPQEGDFLFQSLPEMDLVIAIEGATNSPYSHVGVVVKGVIISGKKEQWLVREAIGPVKDTPLLDWIRQGREQKFDAYRLNDAHQEAIPKMLKASLAYMGLPYDPQYSMDDDKIYCSELWYKAMRTATGLTLGKTVRLGDLNWKPYTATIQKYEQGKPPLEREMITPRDLARAEQLTPVFLGLTNRD